jgi:hypothetical protein
MPALAVALLVRTVCFVLGAAVVAFTLSSTIRILVLPRSSLDVIARSTFVLTRRAFTLQTKRARTYEDRDRIMALFAPVGLFSLIAVWLFLVFCGYLAMYWALGAPSFYAAFRLSGSALFTLGFDTADDPVTTTLSFTEAAIGLGIVALLIAYLPTIYGAFSRREAAVTLLEVRAGSPPSAEEMILRYHRIHGLDRLTDAWPAWEAWFVDIEETHTSLAALPFFRSPQSHRSWVTAAGAVLDCAALLNSTVDVPRDPLRDLCIRAGYLALRQIAKQFFIPFNPEPLPTEPISIARSEYDAVCDNLARAGVPLKPDRDDAWRHFAGWRVNYDAALLGLAAVTMAPEAPWSSDRSLRLSAPGRARTTSPFPKRR